MNSLAIRTVVVPLHDRQTIGEGRDLLCSAFFHTAAAATIEECTVVTSFGDNLLGGRAVLLVEGLDLSLCGSIWSSLGRERTVVERREELADEGGTGEVTRPAVGGTQVWHTGFTEGVDEIHTAGVGHGVKTILTNREDNLLHSIMVDIVVGHEELLVTAIAVLLRVGERIFAHELVSVAFSLLHGLLGGDSRVIDVSIEPQTCMKQKRSTAVGATVVVATVVSANLGHLRLDGFELLIQPLHHLGTRLVLRIGRQVEVSLERTIVEEVKKIPVVEGTEEANLSADTLVRFVVSHVREEEVVLCDIIHQTLVGPLYTTCGGVPADSGNLRDTSIVLPSPKQLVGAELLQIEGSAVKTCLTGVHVGHVAIVVRTFLA